MGDDDHDAAALAHRQDRLIERFVAGAVKARIRLVENDQEGIAIEGTSESHALALTAGEHGAASPILVS